MSLISLTFRMRNQSGSVVMTTLIAFTIVGVAIYSAAELSQKTALVERASKRSGEIDDFVDLFGKIIYDPIFCTKNLQTQTFVPTLNVKTDYSLNLHGLNDDTSLQAASLFAVGQPVANNLILDKVQYELTASLGDRRYSGKMYLSIKSSEGLLGGNYFIRSVPFHITLDAASDQLVSCGKGTLATNLATGVILGSYSQSCSDFVAKGWPNKRSCITDGRWHLLQTTTASSSNANADLDTAITKGADIMIGFTYAVGDATLRKCTQSFIHSNIPYCHSGLNYSGALLDTGSNPFSQNNPNLHRVWLSAATIIYRGDTRYRVVKLDPSIDDVPTSTMMMRVDNDTLGVPIRWYVKY